MNKKTRFGTALAVSLVATSVLSGCASDNTSNSASTENCEPRWEFPTVANGKLNVAIYELMPYFSEMGSSPEGVDADFLTEFAADACLSIDWQVQPASSVIQAVASGRADIAGGGWYATPERGEVVNLSAPIYVELPSIASFEGTADIEDLRGKVVGTISGYTWNQELGAIASEVKEYQSTDSALQDIAAGRIDYALLGGVDSPYVVAQNDALSDIKVEIMERNPAISSSENPQLPNFSHTKGNEALTAALTEKIQEMQQNGEYAAIVEKYGLDPKIVEVDQYVTN